MTEAIFGLVGVLIGGLLNGGVSFLTERRELQAGAKVAARLVISELEVNLISVESATKRDNLRQLTFGAVTVWAERRTTLAAVLTDEEWSAIDNFYAMFGFLLRFVESDEAEEESKESLEGLSIKGKWALKALRQYAGEDVTVRVDADSLKLD